MKYLSYCASPNWRLVKLFKDVFKRSLEDILNDVLGVGERMGLAPRMQSTHALTQARREEVRPGCCPLRQLHRSDQRPLVVHAMSLRL